MEIKKGNHHQLVVARQYSVGLILARHLAIAANETIYVPSGLRDRQLDNYLLAIVSLKASEYEAFCRDRRGRLAVAAGDYRPYSPLYGFL